jgi:DNA-binding transcriptional ArsR family regulator
MVEYPEELDAVFHALADRTRRAMLQRLAGGARSVGELAAPFDMSLAAASKHIRVLERAGLVRRSVRGRTHLCSLDAQPMHGGLEWMRHYEQFWNRRLDDLEQALRAEQEAADDSGQPPKTRSKR